MIAEYGLILLWQGKASSFVKCYNQNTRFGLLNRRGGQGLRGGCHGSEGESFKKQVVNIHIPFAEAVLALLGVVVRSGVSWLAAEPSSPLIVEVEVVRPNPLVNGARCVSFNSVMNVSQHSNTHVGICFSSDVLLVNFHDISATLFSDCSQRKCKRPPGSGKGEQEGSAVGEWPRIACNLGIFLDRQSIARRIEGGVRQGRQQQVKVSVKIRVKSMVRSGEGADVK